MKITPNPPKKELPKFAVWDIRENIHYYLDFVAMEINYRTGEFSLKGRLHETAYNPRTLQEVRAEKISELVEKFKNDLNKI